MVKRRGMVPCVKSRRRGCFFFFALLAKLSRVYQFNCGNTAVISREELEGKA